MKKSLVTLLALVFVLSIGASALAAGNPFVDVPTTSWAYGAINKLVAAGVIDGYGDGTFHGDKAMTRYEAAQMVAKAMAKEDMATAENKALIDKLAVEFATELNNLGVRVAKLEAGASSIKFSGDARVRYSNQWTNGANANLSGGEANAAQATGGFYDRFRLNMTSQVNDTTTFNGRIGTNQEPAGTNQQPELFDMNLVTKNVFGSGVNVTLGRQDVAIGPTAYFMSTTGMVDAAKVGFAVDKGNLDLGYGDFHLINQTPIASAAVTAVATSANPSYSGFDKAVWANLTYPVSSNFKFNLSYFDDVAGVAANTTNMQVIDLGLVANLGNNFGFVGEYWVNDAKNGLGAIYSTNPHAYVLRLTYKGVNPKVAGSWGMFAEFYNAQYDAMPASTGASTTAAYSTIGDCETGNFVNFQNNQKAFDLQVSYALATNITVDAIQTFNTQLSEQGAAASTNVGNFTRVQVNYFF
jgi:hypothetical protein